MSVQQVMGAPSNIINIMIGTIVFFTALPGITPWIAAQIEKAQKKPEDLLVSKDGTPLESVKKKEA